MYTVRMRLSTMTCMAAATVRVHVQDPRVPVLVEEGGLRYLRGCTVFACVTVCSHVLSFARCLGRVQVHVSRVVFRRTLNTLGGEHSKDANQMRIFTERLVKPSKPCVSVHLQLRPKDTVAPSNPCLGAYCGPDQTRERHVPRVAYVDWCRKYRTPTRTTVQTFHVDRDGDPVARTVDDGLLQPVLRLVIVGEPLVAPP